LYNFHSNNINSLQKAENLDSAFDYCTATVVVYVSSMNVIWTAWNIAFCNHITQYDMKTFNKHSRTDR